MCYDWRILVKIQIARTHTRACSRKAGSQDRSTSYPATTLSNNQHTTGSPFAVFLSRAFERSSPIYIYIYILGPYCISLILAAQVIDGCCWFLVILINLIILLDCCCCCCCCLRCCCCCFTFQCDDLIFTWAPLLLLPLLSFTPPPTPHIMRTLLSVAHSMGRVYFWSACIQALLRFHRHVQNFCKTNKGEQNISG